MATGDAERPDGGRPATEVDALLREFAEIFAGMRGESKFQLKWAVAAAQQGWGGTLLVQLPCQSKKRQRTEVVYRSDRWHDVSVTDGRLG